MDFEVRRVPGPEMGDHDGLSFSREHVVGGDFSGRRLRHFSSVASRFERCDFRGTVIDSVGFGDGRSVTEYVECDFSGSTLHPGSGGRARFVDCSFEDTVIEAWFCFDVELVRCTFSGRLRKVVFNGTVPEEDRVDLGRAVNEFTGNDFSRAQLLDVGFRTGIDLRQQRLPTGDEYTLLLDAADAVRRAKIAWNAWEDSEGKKRAKGVLAVMERGVARGQLQLLIRADDYPRSSRPAIRGLLAAALET